MNAAVIVAVGVLAIGVTCLGIGQLCLIREVRALRKAQASNKVELVLDGRVLGEALQRYRHHRGES